MTIKISLLKEKVISKLFNIKSMLLKRSTTIANDAKQI